MSKYISCRAASVCAAVLLLVSCTDRAKETQQPFFSESDAVATVQALTETPAACGPSFDENYSEHAIPPPGSSHNLVLPGITTRPWPKNLLQYRLRLPADTTDLTKVVVRDPADTVLARQVDVCRVEANGEIIARLSFFGDQPQTALDTTYKVAIEPAAAAPLTTSAARNVTASYVELSNAQLAVRVPKLGEQTFGSVDMQSAASVAAPILQFRLGAGPQWITPSSFEGTKRKLTSLEVFSGATGPLFNEVLLAYEFAPTDPSKPPGYWRVAIKVVHDISMVFIEEEYDFGDEEPETAVDQWKLTFSSPATGWTATHLTAAWGLAHALGEGTTTIQAEPVIYGSESMPLTATPVEFPAVTPFLATNAEQYWSGVRDGSGRFAGIVPLFGGAWRRYPKIAMTASESEVALRFELGITTPKEPSYQLSTAGDDKALPRSTARRQWGLVLGAPKTNLEMFTLRGRYGSLSMNDIKEWQLDNWPGIDTTAPPNMLLSPTVRSLASSAYGTGTLPEPVQAALSNFYATSGDEAAPPLALTRFYQFLLGAAPLSGAGYVNHPIMFGSLLSPGSAVPSTFAPMTHYRAGQFVLAELLARAEDYLSWPDADPAERRKLRQHIAMMAHLISHPEFAPVVSGAAQGNPAMALDRSAALPMLLALIPEHPMAVMPSKVLARSFAYYRTMAETYLSTGGSFRESSPNYQNAGLPYIEVPLLAFQRLGLSFEPQAMLENATHYQVGTIGPIVGRYGMRMWEPFGNSGMSPVTSPLITAAIYDQRGDIARAQQALKVWELGGSICNDDALGLSGCMMAAYAAVHGPGNNETLDLSSKFLPGMGVSLRGRPDTEQESFVMLRGGYNASHMDPAEGGAFSFHSAGDELIGFPDDGYIKGRKTSAGQPAWPAAAGEPWSGIRSPTAVVRTGEWSDTGFTDLADYAFFNTGLGRYGYETGAWIRQAMLLKGEQLGDYDYVVFRDTRPKAGDEITSVHIATRLPAASWGAGGSNVLTGRHGGGLRATLLDSFSGDPYSVPLGLDYHVEEKPHCLLREEFAGGDDGRPGSPLRVPTVDEILAGINTFQADCLDSNSPNVGHSSIDINVGHAQNASWMLQSGFGTPLAPATTKLDDGVFKITTSYGTDYVFMRDKHFSWVGSGVDDRVSFSGRAGVLRIRGDDIVLSLNAGNGTLRYRSTIDAESPSYEVSGEGPLLCRTLLTSPTTSCNSTAPSPPYTIPTVSGSSTPIGGNQRVRYIAQSGVRQFKVEIGDGSPIAADLIASDGSRVVIDGIVQGAITIYPDHTNFTVLSGTGLFTAGGQTIFGGGPFSVDRYPDRVEGNSEGRPRALWVDGMHVASTLDMDGVKVTNQEIPTIWLTSIGLIGGPHAFKLYTSDDRLDAPAHPNYTLDRITGRTTPPTREPPPGAMVFSGYGSFHDPARWNPHAPVAGDTVFISSDSGASLLSDTPQLASIIVEGEIAFHSSVARLRATDVEVCGVVTHAPNLATSTVSGGWPIDARVQIEATSFKLCSTGRIDVDGKGFQARQTTGGGYGPSAGAADDAMGAGAGHGGRGGRNHQLYLAGGAPHDDVQHPTSPGSGGGSNQYESLGGAGGGVVRIVATGRATIDGIVTANGLPALKLRPAVTHSGGGSGGAIEISCAELVGSGLVRADGGSTTGDGGGGGGGGRVAVHYTSLPAPFASVRLSAGGGRVPANGGEAGEPGTVYLPDGRFFPGTNVVDSLELVLGSSSPIRRTSLTFQDSVFYSPIDVPLYIDNALTVRGASSLVKLRGDTWTKSVDAKESARLELVSPSAAQPGTNGRFGSALRVAGQLGVVSGATFTPRSDPSTGVSPQIIARSVLVGAGSAISADGTGYAGVLGADGQPASLGWGDYNYDYGVGSGGDYGGVGGQAVGTGAGGSPYGSETAPDQPGSSGGGSRSDALLWPGGAGGGLVHLQVAGTVHIDGTLTANGGNAPQYFGGNPSHSGGGSGGGIYLVCDTLEGTSTGAIRARGGSPLEYGGGGGGGRIAIYRRVQSWNGEAIALPGSVSGGPVTGTGTVTGTAGSLVIGTTTPPGTEPQSIFGPDLVAFYRSDSGVLRDASGLVELWTDRSMNGNHSAQSVTSSRPSLVTSGRYPAVAFVDNPAKWLEALAVSGGTVASTHGLYTWAVRRQTSGGIDTWHTYLGGRNTDLNAAFGMSTPERAVDHNITVASPSGPQILWAVAGSPAQLNDEWHYNDGYLNPTSGLVAALDGNVIASAAAPTTVVGGSLARIDIGRHGPGSVNDFQGEIYEVGIARVNPSPDQLTAMRAYLDQRYIGEVPLSIITSPASGAIFPVPGVISITTKVAAHYRSEIQRVEFYSGATLIGTRLNAPYNFDWSSVPAGIYSLTARAYGTDGLIGISAPKTITVNADPTVSITSPASGSIFFKPVGGNASIPVTATASDSDGTIAFVAFYGDLTQFGEDSAAPYTATWTSATPGPHTLNAGAMDVLGGTASSSIPITVWETTDIGSVGVAGSVSYSGTTFTEAGAGAGITGSTDAFRFAFKQVNSTSFTLTARIASASGTNTNARTGLMVREQLTGGSKHASILYKPSASTGAWFHRRTTTGGTTATSNVSSGAPRWLRVTRSGNTFTTFQSSNGTSWTAVGSAVTVAMSSTVYVGLATTSGTTGSSSIATIDNVSIP